MAENVSASWGAPEKTATTPVTRSGARVPRSVEQVFKLTQAQFREYLSSRRFVILVGIIVAIGVILSAVIAHFKSTLSGPGGLLSSNLAFYGSIWGGAVDIVIVLSAVFFGGDAIAGEFQNKTGYFLMGLPIRRSAVYIGKWIAAFGASLCMMGLFFVICIANGFAYFPNGALPWQLFLSGLLAVVYLAAVLGTTFLFSSLFKTSAYGFVLTAILFLFGFTLIQDLVQDLAGIEPWMVISYAESTIGNVFTPITPTCQISWGLSRGTCTTTTSVGRFSMTTVTYPAGIAEGVVIMLAYFLVTAVLGLLLFEREEFA